MNVLVIGGGAWVETSSLGNTFSNFFENWEDTEFYNLYFRGTLPQNNVCDNYFSITDMSILKNYFTPKNIGCRVQKKSQSKSVDVASREKKLISYIHKFNLKLVYNFEDFLWRTDKWKNEKLDEFLKEADPDIVFTFASGNSNIVRSVEYIKKNSGAKIVTFIADDVHNEYLNKHDKMGRRLEKNLDVLFKISDKIYGISEQMCEKYTVLTNKKVSLLKKGCKEFTPLKQTYELPLKIVYAGNLLYGRDKTLAQLAKELHRINSDSTKVQLEIYSGSEVSQEMKNELEYEGTSLFMGECPYSEITEILRNSDVVLHAESFEDDNIELVKYSFSTKVIDCLQSGNLVMAIGPECVSSIKYTKLIPGAIVIDDKEKVFETVSGLVNESPDNWKLKAESIREFALLNHDGNNNRKKLRAEFLELMR